MNDLLPGAIEQASGILWTINVYPLSILLVNLSWLAKFASIDKHLKEIIGAACHESFQSASH